MGEGRRRGSGGRAMERFISAEKPRWLVPYYLQEGDISNSGEKERNEEGLKNKGMGRGILHVSSRM